MPLQVQITVLGDEQMARTLERTGRHAGDLRPVWGVIEEDIKQMNREQFLTLGQRGSGGWSPLADTTVERKSHEPNMRQEVLRFTDALFNAATSYSDPNQEIMKLEDQFLFRVVGDPGDYGARHQSGTSKMPMRKVMEFTELDRQRFMKDIQRFVLYGTVEWIDRVL